MNKKRLIAVIIAAVVVIGLVSAGIVLLDHRANIEVTGKNVGTIGVNTVEKPDNLGELEFGITLATVFDGGGGGSSVVVKNGNTVTITDREVEGDKATIYIMRSTATSDFMPTTGLDDGIVYEEDIPLTLVWDKADILSTVDWSDDYLNKYGEVKTEYQVIYTESCAGNFYISQVNVTYWDDDGDPHYIMYSVCLSVTLKEE